jgi:hypothetical protein
MQETQGKLFNTVGRGDSRDSLKEELAGATRCPLGRRDSTAAEIFAEIDGSHCQTSCPTMTWCSPNASSEHVPVNFFTCSPLQYEARGKGGQCASFLQYLR